MQKLIARPNNNHTSDQILKMHIATKNAFSNQGLNALVFQSSAMKADVNNLHYDMKTCLRKY